MSKAGDPVGPSGRRRLSRQERCAATTGFGAAVAVAVAATCLLVLWNALWTNRGSDSNKVPDPSVVIGTFITLYVLFMGAFGTLVGFITGRPVGIGFKTMAITLIVIAVSVDLWRVEDSTGDLYRAAAKGLSYHQLGDDVHDFKQYFFVNVFAVAVAIAVACWPASPRKQHEGSSGS